MASHDDACYLLTEDGESSTFEMALDSPDASLWMVAMQKEMKALHRKQDMGTCSTSTRTESDW